jgi:hypothetical protein
MKDLQEWLSRVKAATSSAEIFELLDQFRPGDWTDEERSLMSKTYIAALARLGDIGAPSQRPLEKVGVRPKEPSVQPEEEGQAPLAESDETIDQESVWYERM